MNLRTTVRPPAELLKRAKRKAVAEARALTALIEGGLRQVLAEKKERHRSKEHKPLPVSKATGGLRPGIDLSDIQHMDDLEYVERMKHFK